MERKLISIGNSLGVSLPVELLRKYSLEKGDEIIIADIDGKIVLSKKQRVPLIKGISDDFFHVLNESVEKYDAAIKGLVDR